MDHGVSNAVVNNGILYNCVGLLSGPPPGQNNFLNKTFTANTYNEIWGQDSFSCGASRYKGRHHAGAVERRY